MEVVVGSYEGLLLGYRLKTEDEGFALEMCFTNHTHKGCVKAVAMSHRGLLASGSTDESIQVFNVRQSKEMGSLIRHEGSITSLSFFKNTHMFSTGEDGNVCIWKTYGWECLRTLRGHKGPAYSVSVHPSGKMALSVSKDKTMRTWNLVKGRSAYITNLHEVADVVMWSPTGDRYVIVFNNKLSVYSVETAQVENTLQQRLRISAITFLRDGTLVLSSEGGVLQFYDLSTLKKLYEFETNTNRVRGICCCPPPEGVERECMVTASSDGHIKVWQVTTAAQEGTWTNTLIAEVDTKFRLTCLGVWKGIKASLKQVKPEKPSKDSEDELEESEEEGSVESESEGETSVSEDEDEVSEESEPETRTSVNEDEDDSDQVESEESEEEDSDESELETSPPVKADEDDSEEVELKESESEEESSEESDLEEKSPVRGRSRTKRSHARTASKSRTWIVTSLSETNHDPRPPKKKARVVVPSTKKVTSTGEKSPQKQAQAKGNAKHNVKKMNKKRK